jgi:hypothetical protein
MTYGYKEVCYDTTGGRAKVDPNSLWGYFDGGVGSGRGGCARLGAGYLR